MGYYTRFNIEAIGVKDVDLLTNALEDANIVNYAVTNTAYVKDDYVEYCCIDCVKWYDEREDMLRISKMFPEVTFKVSGEGEETGDLWESYYKNGQYEYCEAHIIYDKPTKIKWRE